MSDDTRKQFETACFAYYQRLKAAGWSHPDEGDATPESLFWRKPNGMYGVAQVEAAWQGFLFAVQPQIDELPPLPEKKRLCDERWGYQGADMVDYARAAISAAYPSIAADAAAYAWLLRRNPSAICGIAWSVPAARDHGTPDEAVKAAMRAEP